MILHHNNGHLSKQLIHKMPHNTKYSSKYNKNYNIFKYTNANLLVNIYLLKNHKTPLKNTILYLHKTKHRTKTKGPSAKNLAISKSSKAASKTAYVLFETYTDLS